ncbi:hypothetical protein QVD17_34399 [Tagetes erecta]|uniref:Protein kinase domain-containing protein n=1 Tax=Tagetes erecta TaxID=13708 RepID=A0AAD8K0L5_TARER|nr:hypothetical protein QVD17_34399 [Tagetes erecta]
MEAEMSSSQLCRQFSLDEVLLATQNFDDALVVGKGGFGIVYKATISVENGATFIVAIKRLDSDSNQGPPEFWAEIDMLTKLRHCNLVSLVGTQHGVIHRDVKSSNILLDKEYDAKISDFGLSKIGPTNASHTYVNTLVRGTFGYLDPEYFLTGRLTKKSDVFAYRCLSSESKKRPTMTEILLALEHSVTLQNKFDSRVKPTTGMFSIARMIKWPFNSPEVNSAQSNRKLSTINEVTVVPVGSSLKEGNVDHSDGTPLGEMLDRLNHVPVAYALQESSVIEFAAIELNEGGLIPRLMTKGESAWRKVKIGRREHSDHRRFSWGKQRRRT